jgi:hypothetical protein
MDSCLAIFLGKKESKMLALHFFWGVGKIPHGKTVVSYVARPFGDRYVYEKGLYLDPSPA